MNPILRLMSFSPYSVTFKQKLYKTVFPTWPFVYNNVQRKIEMNTMKPPNILVFTGDKEPGCFNSIAENLRYCLNPESYVIYELNSHHVLKHPWQENSQLLVICCENMDKTISDAFIKYLLSGGKILNVCSNFEVHELDLECSVNTKSQGLVKGSYKDINEVVFYDGKYKFVVENKHSKVLCCDSNNVPLITKIADGDINIVVSRVRLIVDAVLLQLGEGDFSVLKQHDFNRLSILKDILSSELSFDCSDAKPPVLTPGYVISNDNSFIGKIKDPNEKNIGKMKLKVIDAEEEIPETNPLLLPIVLNGPKLSDFNQNLYFSNLKTKTLGHNALFVDVITTTMAISEVFSEFNGMVVIANVQTEGKGRGGNKWVSPRGCVAFTLHYSVTFASKLGQRLSVIQHLISLCIVKAVRTQQGYEDIDLRLKWPNDIYYGSSCKICGILVNSTIQGNSAHVYIGCGINLNNSRPTLCINDLIRQHNSTHKESLKLLSAEELIAWTITEFEHLLQQFEMDPKAFLTSYYAYWLHTDQVVTLPELGESAKISGIDDYGFLVVKTEAGKELTLQPDGNSFDIMKNCIVTKR